MGARVRGRDGGSSPHTRGLPMSSGGSSVGRRIIPAHAGFTGVRVRAGEGREDHPRTRGVYSPAPSRCRESVGSSPHTRGLPVAAVHGEIGRRIIPAHAGFTARALPGRGAGADHPRTRGVYESLVLRDRRGRGSSPHTRGLPFDEPAASTWSGIIPAHAGFTARFLRKSSHWGDHPRTRGVYAASSPATRA